MRFDEAYLSNTLASCAENIAMRLQLLAQAGGKIYDVVLQAPS